MMVMMVLAICGLPPLAILVVAATGLSAGRHAVVLPLAVSAAVLALPLLSPLLRTPEAAPGLRFQPQALGAAGYASLHTVR